MDLFIGVDPGLSGGYAIIDKRQSVVLAERTKTVKIGGKKRDTDWLAILSSIEQALSRKKGLLVVAALEEVTTFPRDGRVGAFRFGESFGGWKALLASLRLEGSFHLYPPKFWQARIFGVRPPKSDTKEMAVKKCRELFAEKVVHDKLKVKANQGIADALLMAEVLRSRYAGLE